MCVFLCIGNPCPYVIEDQNEDTISALVRLITEKKGILLLFVLIIDSKEQFVYVLLAKTSSLCVFQKMQLPWKRCYWNMRRSRHLVAKDHQSSKKANIIYNLPPLEEEMIFITYTLTAVHANNDAHVMLIHILI